jgi:hypothetical protein
MPKFKSAQDLKELDALGITINKVQEIPRCSPFPQESWWLAL